LALDVVSASNLQLLPPAKKIKLLQTLSDGSVEPILTGIIPFDQGGLNLPHQQLWIRLTRTAAVVTIVLNGTTHISGKSDPNGVF
jgi:hypothetical protein